MRLIDADFLKEWVDEYLSVFKKYDKGTIKGFVDHAPTIEPKRGEWIENIKNVSDLIWHEYECDQCGELALMRHNFCPNCGADMRKESE